MRTPTVGLTSAQRQAHQQIRAAAAQGDTPLVRVQQLGTHDGAFHLRLHLRTDQIEVKAGGMPLHRREEVLIELPNGYPWVPPTVWIEHDRFTGFPHVLAGTVLCLYLDPAQEWHPAQGTTGFLNQLWRWFQEAAAGTFDARRALFHPVGGLAHLSADAPTVVVRTELPSTSGPSRMAIRRRSGRRWDLLPTSAAAAEDLRVLVLALNAPLSYGGGLTLRDLLRRLVLVGTVGISAMVEALGRTAARNPPEADLYLVLAVPGDPLRPAAERHLIAGCLPAAAAADLRAAVQRAGPTGVDVPSKASLDTPIQWCRVSEERTSMTTRRDTTRPIARFQGTHVVLWGCGGLGSWVAGFLARAGAARLTLADPGTVTGGLLVRQDYVETDIGANKAEALAQRLRAIRDDLVPEVMPAFSGLEEGSLPDCDVLLDCTVANAAAAATSLVWATTTTTPLVARMATDRASSTLGLLSVSRPGSSRPDLEDVDRLTAQTVEADPSLEAYRCFWEEPLSDDELLAEPGCSIPTFHGSAADLAAIAAVLTTQLAHHLDALPLAGSHLSALPHSLTGAPGTRWVPCRAP